MLYYLTMLYYNTIGSKPCPRTGGWGKGNPFCGASRLRGIRKISGFLRKSTSAKDMADKYPNEILRKEDGAKFPPDPPFAPQGIKYSP